MKIVRTAARAIIIHEGKLLTIKMHDKNGLFYILPGGGQRHGETLDQTLLRECREEIDAEVRIGELLYVREYLGKNHTFAHRHSGFHQLEVVFRCNLEKMVPLGPGSETDRRQVGVQWIDLKHIHQYPFYPEVLKPFFSEDDIQIDKLYLGDVN